LTKTVIRDSERIKSSEIQIVVDNFHGLIIQMKSSIVFYSWNGGYSFDKELCSIVEPGVGNTEVDLVN